MNHIKVKTKEKAKSIKTLDKAAIAGERMKNAYIRTREAAVKNQDNRQDSPTAYAEDRVQDAARRVARNTARTARLGGNVIRQKGREVFRRQEDRKGVPQTGDSNSEMLLYKEPFPFETHSPRPNPAAQKQKYRRYFYRSKVVPSHDLTEMQDFLPYAPTTNLATEQGREYAKKQAIKRIEAAKRIREKDSISFIRQKESAPRRQDVPSPGKIHKGLRTSKAAERTTRSAVNIGEKSALAAKRAERIAAYATRSAAKAAAVSAKRAAKVSAAAVKGILAATQTLISAIAAGGGVAIIGVVVICLIGQLACSSFGIFFSGEDNGTGQTMTTAVQEIDREFEDRLAEIQSGVDYDILDMSGSRASWPDILAVYAVKTTSDPANGQEVATMDDAKKQILRGIFWAMNTIDSSVSVRTYEVSSTTRDDAGNTVETTETETEVTLHITISHKAAAEMADSYRFNANQREQLGALLSAENRSLWDAVLRGAGVSVGGGGDIVSVALSQVGNVGGQPYWSWYGFDSRVEWCTCFVSWCANESGVSIPKFSRCVDGVAWFKGQSLWQSSSYFPQPGDIIFFDWDNGGGQDGIPDHVGIVEKVEDGVIYTIEGNSAGDRCRENRYAVGSYLIYGYGTSA